MPLSSSSFLLNDLPSDNSCYVKIFCVHCQGESDGFHGRLKNIKYFWCLYRGTTKSRIRSSVWSCARRCHIWRIKFKVWTKVWTNQKEKACRTLILQAFLWEALTKKIPGLKIRISGWHESAFIFTLQFGCLVLEFQISFSVLMPLFDQTTVFQ